MGDSLMRILISTETPTSNNEIQKGYLHPPHSALNFSTPCSERINIMTPNAKNNPKVAVV